MSRPWHVTMPPAERGFWLTTEIAPVLGCCSKTVVKLIDQGRIAGYMLPGSKRRVVRDAALVEFLNTLPSLRELLPRAEAIRQMGVTVAMEQWRRERAGEAAGV